ncbi:MAG: type I restriction enzyme HsdR N-terminal domain-containing protein [Bacteroidales bacterium]|jgi:type I restriction enzyme M protein|nr:type I restriction enzyme HsdR N-terminal domain-containing protein [Bacteroidales bacterium]
MDFKKWVTALGFSAKDGSEGVFIKKYPNSRYALEVDFVKESIGYGDLITCDSKTTQNFSQSESFVVLECVDRLLTKGYKPQNIVLEKVYPSGHGTSGRLDICVNREDGSPYLLIECKT